MAHADKPNSPSEIDQADDQEFDNTTSKTVDSRNGQQEVAKTEPHEDELQQDENDPEVPLNAEVEVDDQNDVSVEALFKQLESAREEVTSFKDRALRAEAEAQNVRKRAQRDVEKAHRFGLERFLTSLLPVIDSLEKAIESANQAAEKNDAIVEGVDICLKMLLDLLQKENVRQIDPEGEPFDPQFHEAMSVMANPDVEPNTVLNVFLKGYTLNERLVRAAMVIVSKAP